MTEEVKGVEKSVNNSTGDTGGKVEGGLEVAKSDDSVSEKDNELMQRIKQQDKLINDLVRKDKEREAEAEKARLQAMDNEALANEYKAKLEESAREHAFKEAFRQQGLDPANFSSLNDGDPAKVAQTIKDAIEQARSVAETNVKKDIQSKVADMPKLSTENMPSSFTQAMRKAAGLK